MDWKTHEKAKNAVKQDTTTVHARSASKRPVLLRLDLAFAGDYTRIEWDRHQCQNEVNRMGPILNMRLL
jgi:hypothetical protein